METVSTLSLFGQPQMLSNTLSWKVNGRDAEIETLLYENCIPTKVVGHRSGDRVQGRRDQAVSLAAFCLFRPTSTVGRCSALAPLIFVSRCSRVRCVTWCGRKTGSSLLENICPSLKTEATQRRPRSTIAGVCRSLFAASPPVLFQPLIPVPKGLSNISGGKNTYSNELNASTFSQAPPYLGRTLTEQNL